MKRTAYLGCSLLLILAAVIPTLAQQQEPPDVTAYRNFYNEKDPVKQAELGEKFLAEAGAAFKDSQYRQNTYSLTFQAYLTAKNWAKAMDTAERLPQLVPTLPANRKEDVYLRAMAAAQQANNLAKIMEFGEKVLAINPNNLNALITLAPMLVARLPDEAAAKDAALTKAMDYAKKALAQPKPAGVQDPQWQAVQGQMHSTVGFVHLNRQQYAEAIGEYEQSLKADPKEAVDQWRLGLSYQGLARAAQGPVVEAYNKENEAKAAKAEQAVIDEIIAKRDTLQKDFFEKRDKAIDALAKAVAIGGDVAPLARQPLESLYKNKNNDSLTGLDELIAQKKTELGVK